MRGALYVAHTAGRRDVYRALVGSHGGKRPLGRPSRRWKYNTKMDLQGLGWRTRTELLWLKLGSVGWPS